MSGSHLPIGLEGVDFTAAYTVSTSVPEYPGAGMQVGTRVNAGNGGSGFSSSRAVRLPPTISR